MKYVRNQNFFTKLIDQTWYILERDKKTVRQLNEVASFIWEILTKPHSVDFIVNKICHNFQVEKQVAKRDVIQFLNQYVKEGLIQKVE